MRFSIITALLVLFFSVGSAVCQESSTVLKENTFIMSITRPETDHLGKWGRLVYTEIFRRLGVKVEFRYYPPKRASMEVEIGNVDGEPGRLYEYAAEHPNLIRVEESLFYVTYHAFAVKDSIPQLKGWDSIRGTNYKVEYRRGVTIFERNLPKLVSKENLSDITEAIQGLKKLVSGRTDIFFDEELCVLTLLQTPEFKDSRIHSVGVMDSTVYYPYLHKKNASLVLKMAEAIKAMKKEGLVDQYRMTAAKDLGVGIK